MRLAVLKERQPGEARVAATPDTVKKLLGLGLTVAIETGAGTAAAITDEDYRAAGAVVAADPKTVLAGAGILFAVQAPAADIRAMLPRGILLVCTMNTFGKPELVPALAAAGIDGVAMEMVPRITRAQSMDVLSSQANLAGYRAVIEAAGAFARGFPMMMTAAGTVPPARVLVIGAGVAGLQAIATARRLGGIVSGTDVRPAAKEEIRSLGATYIGVDDEESAKQTGPYAGQMSDAFRQKQAELMAATVAKNDMVICTALVQGRRAPVIVTEAMVAAMRPGSVIVDLAADAGGNCAATVPGEVTTTANGVIVIGHRNWPARIAVAASQLYARNLMTFLTTFWDRDAGAPKLTETDDIVKGVLLTQGGKIMHPNFKDEVPAADTPANVAAPTVAAPGGATTPATTAAFATSNATVPDPTDDTDTSAEAGDREAIAPGSIIPGAEFTPPATPVASPDAASSIVPGSIIPSAELAPPPVPSPNEGLAR